MSLGLILGAGKYATHLHEQLRHTRKATAAIAISAEMVAGQIHGSQIDEHIDGTFGIGQIDEALAMLVRAGVDRVIFGGDFRAFSDKIANGHGEVGSVAELVRRVSGKLVERGIEPVHASKELPDLAIAPGLIGGPNGCGVLSDERLLGHAFALAQSAQTATDLAGIPLLAIRQSILFDHLEIVPIPGARGTDDLLEKAKSRKKAPGLIRALVKLTAKDIDSRLDPPVIGLKTIESADAADVSLVVLDAYKGIICERKAVLDACKHCGIALVGVASG